MQSRCMSDYQERNGVSQTPDCSPRSGQCSTLPSAAPVVAKNAHQSVNICSSSRTIPHTLVYTRTYAQSRHAQCAPAYARVLIYRTRARRVLLTRYKLQLIQHETTEETVLVGCTLLFNCFIYFCTFHSFARPWAEGTFRESPQ